MSIITSGDGQDGGPVTHAFRSPRTSVSDVGPDNCTSCQSSSACVVKKAKGRSKSKSVNPAPGEEHNNVRLRNSCRSCANSLRNLDCAYLQSKRPGRVPGKSQASQPANQFGMEDTQSAKSANGYAAFAGLPSAVEFGLGDYVADFGRQRIASEFNIPSTRNMDFNLFGTPTSEDMNTTRFYAGSAPTASMGSSGEVSSLEDMVGSDWTMSQLNLADFNSWWTDSINDFSNGSFSLADSNPTSSAASIEPSSLASSSLSSTVNLKNLLEPIAVSQPFAHDLKQLQSVAHSQFTGPNTPASNPRSSCTCMAQALDLLKTLSTTDLPELPSDAVDSYTQRVLLQNKQDIEVNLAILECRACSNDRYLFMTLLMIAAKILARYASAAASNGSRGRWSELYSAMQGEVETAVVISEHADHLVEMSRAWGGLCTTLPVAREHGSAQSPTRETVQRVLRELYLAQRLLTQLAIRRKSLDGHAAGMCSVAMVGESSRRRHERNGSSSRIGSKGSRPSDSTTESATAIPLPSNALESVEAAVRQGLSALSAVMRSLLSNS
ncbi:hypothetical protein LTR22_024678 [Elasticomyces elasticus]|nr:hypothetical protein LTR22_024678 [Elasticomyces elasticus]